MPRKCNELEVGRRFERLVVLGSAGKIGRDAASLCRCDCGAEKAFRNFNLLSGRTVSCNCFRRERASKQCKEEPPRFKHGGRKTLAYSSWIGMIGRCYNPLNVNFPRYGGKGIKVYSSWIDRENGLQNFLKDMGERPSKEHSIDRIDSKGNYEPSNCRWATRSQQNQNVGRKKSVGYKGVFQDKSKWKAEIKADGKRFHLGNYKTLEEAALAYNVASKRLHGPYGVRNALPRIDRTIKQGVVEKVLSILVKGEKLNVCFVCG